MEDPAPNNDDKVLSLAELEKQVGRSELTKELIERGSATWTREERLYVAATAAIDGNIKAAAQLLAPLGFRWKGATLTLGGACTGPLSMTSLP